MFPTSALLAGAATVRLDVSPETPVPVTSHDGLTETTSALENDFIIVPGFGTLVPDSWIDSDGTSWLLRVGKPATTGLALYVFEPRLTAEGSLSWNQIDREGSQLLAEIQSLTETGPSSTCPLVLVAHSLGGLVLKRAICIAHRQQRWQRLFKRIAGAILISCPHSQSNDVQGWQRVSLILKTFSEPKRKQTISPEVASSLADDCLRFEREFSQKPVLSIHEDLETSTGRLPWQSKMLVDESFAHPRVNGIRQGVRTDHNRSACLKDDRNLTSIVNDFLVRNVDKCRKDIGFEALFIYERPKGLELSTTASHTETASVGGYSSEPLPPSSRTSPSLPEAPTGRSNLKLPCLLMPHDRNPRFHGRRDVLSHIVDALIPSTGTGRVTRPTANLHCCALSGPGGIGKTQAAIEFVWDHESVFDAIFWVYAGSSEKLSRSFGRIAVALGLAEEESVEAQDKFLTRDLVLNWLARPIKSQDSGDDERVEMASWLMVYDNADDLGLLDEFWPRSSYGSVIITSRVPQAELQYFSNSKVSNSKVAVLDPFDPTEAANFLLKITQREDDEDDRQSVGAVARTLGGLPLALSSMAGSILRRELTFAEFLREYDDPWSHADLFRRPIGNKKIKGYEHTMLSVWGLEKLKHGAALLDVLSFLDPDGIPEYILESSDAETDMTDFPRTRMQYSEARAELLQSSIVSRDRTAKRLLIHSVIQDTVRARMTDERYSTVYVSALQLLSGVWPYEGDFGFIKNETYRYSACNELYKHVLHIQRLSVRPTAPTTLSKAHIQPPRLILEVAWLSVVRADYSHTASLIDVAEKLCKPLKEDEAGHPDEDEQLRNELEDQILSIHYSRGVLGLHIHEVDAALPSLQEFYTRLQDKLGNSTDQRLGAGLNELGVGYLQKYESVKAEGLFRDSVDMLTHLGTSTPNTISMPQINLGFALWVQNKLDEAESVFKQALTAREVAYGVDDTMSFALGKLLLGYGNVKFAQGHYDESRRMHERCLARYRATIGEYHHRTGDGCVHVAGHYAREHRWDEALSLLDQASRIFGAASYYKPDYARVCFKRWKVLAAMGRLDDASANAADALKLYRSIVPNDLKGIEDLTDADFDKRVMFWSR